MDSHRPFIGSAILTKDDGDINPSTVQTLTLRLTMHDVDNENKNNTGTGRALVLVPALTMAQTSVTLIYCDTALGQLLTLTSEMAMQMKLR
jgi:hypothetical protein